MVDRELRSQYAECFEQIRDDSKRADSKRLLYFEPPGRCKDRGISQVIDFLASQAADSFRQGPDQTEKEFAARLRRASVFLRTDLEYEWPDTIDREKPVPFPVPTAIFCALVTATFFALAVWSPGFLGIAVIVTMLLMGLLVVELTTGNLQAAWEDPETWQQYTESGDFNVWPFFRESDYQFRSVASSQCS